MFHKKSSLSLSLSPAQCEVWMLISESSWRLFNWSNLLCWTVAVLWEYLGWRARFLSLSYSPYILFHATIFIALTRFQARRAGGLQVHRGKWMASSRLEPPVERERCCPKEQWQLWKVKEAWGDRWLTMERDWVTHLTDLTFTAANSVYSLQFFSIALAQFSNEKFFFSKHLVLWTVSCRFQFLTLLQFFLRSPGPISEYFGHLHTNTTAVYVG